MNGMGEFAKRVGEIAVNTTGEVRRTDALNSASGRPDVNGYIELEADALSELRGGQPAAKFEDDIEQTAFGSHVSYIHNEFNFDPTRPLKPYAILTHISLLPIFKLEAEPRTKTGETEARLEARRQIFEALRDEATHSSTLGAAGGDGRESFRGGKDSIIKDIQLLNYVNRYVTTLRSVERLYDHVITALRTSRQPMAAVCAADWNDKLDGALKRSGKSSRLSMMREYALRLSEPEASTHLYWVRHHSHYQTLTVTEQLDAASFVPTDANLEGAPSLTGYLSRLAAGVYRNAATPTGQTTAFDALPEGWSRFLFGRYLQGANYILLPIGVLFTPQFLADSRAFDHTAPRYLDEEWDLLARRYVGPRGKRPKLSEAAFREMWEGSLRDEWLRRSLAAFLNRLVQPLMPTIGAAADRQEKVEFSLVSAADDAAIILTDLQNHSWSAPEEGAGALSPHIHLSQTYVFDLGMNEFERGRLLKRLTDFSTQRYVALGDLPTFRFLHDALDVVQTELSLTIRSWLVSSNRPPPDVGDALPDLGDTLQTPVSTERRSIEANQDFIRKLEQVTIRLTILNDLVDGGISNRASAVAGAVERLHRRVSQLRQRPLPGFMSLDDFLDRRFARDIGAIASVGRRYEAIRRRVAELSALVSANVEIMQNDEQKSLLVKVDRLTLFGIVYYFGSVFAYIIGPLVVLAWLLLSKYFGLNGSTDSAGAEPKLELENVVDWVKLPAFIMLGVIGIVIGKEVLAELIKEIRNGALDYRALITKRDGVSNRQ